MSVQGDADGGQLKKLFRDYNRAVGSEIVSMKYSYNSADSYYKNPSAGSQIRDALMAINANEGFALFDMSLTYTWSTGGQLNIAANILQDHIDGGVTPPPTTTIVWQVLGAETLAHEAAWPYSLSDKISGAVGVVTYSVTAGLLPTGMTLNASTGGVTGTADVGLETGSVTFGASDDNGLVSSTTVSFNVVDGPIYVLTSDTADVSGFVVGDTAPVTVHLTRNGINFQGATVIAISDNESIVTTAVGSNTDANGDAVITLTSVAIGTANVEITTENETVMVTVTTVDYAIGLNPANLFFATANIPESFDSIVTVTLDGNPVVGTAVSFVSGDVGMVTASANGVTDGNGQITLTGTSVGAGTTGIAVLAEGKQVNLGAIIS